MRAVIAFDLDADSFIHLENPGVSIPRVSVISMLRYDPGVAVPRIVETNKGFGIKQTFFVRAWCIERYPKSIENMLEGGHEVAFHDYIHENPTVAGRVNEVYWLLRSIEIIEHHWPVPARLARTAV